MYKKKPIGSSVTVIDRNPYNFFVFGIISAENKRDKLVLEKLLPLLVNFVKRKWARLSVIVPLTYGRPLAFTKKIPRTKCLFNPFDFIIYYDVTSIAERFGIHFFFHRLKNEKFATAPRASFYGPPPGDARRIFQSFRIKVGIRIIERSIRVFFGFGVRYCSTRDGSRLKRSQTRRPRGRLNCLPIMKIRNRGQFLRIIRFYGRI